MVESTADLAPTNHGAMKRGLQQRYRPDFITINDSMCGQENFNYRGESGLRMTPHLLPITSGSMFIPAQNSI